MSRHWPDGPHPVWPRVRAEGPRFLAAAAALALLAVAFFAAGIWQAVTELDDAHAAILQADHEER